MKYDVCPNCGGTVRAESIGWKCNNCRGFISLQDGKFYEYVEKPFMPQMTNADRIRAMSDEDLAAWIAGMTTVCECCAELNECEAPRGFNRCSHGVEDWLKQPYEGE